MTRAPVAAASDAEPSDTEAPGASAYWTSLRYFAVSRVVLAALLLLYALLGEPARTAGPRFDAPLFLWTGAVYLLAALALLAVVGVLRQRFPLQVLAAAVTDLVALVVLMHAAGGTRSGFGVLLVAAVAGAAVVSKPRIAASFAAAASLLLLGDAVIDSLDGDTAGDGGGITAAGLIGAACFATAVLISRLASRLAAQESLAAQRGQDLERQLAITRLVVAQLPQGVVVVDERGEVRTMNRSAQALLGATGPWPWLGALVREHPIVEGNERVLELDLAAHAPVGPARRVQVRMMRPVGVHRAHIVLVLEDRQALEERAQQLKLASMGRLSASIAHEIRNPLAAIRHANGLLAERLEGDLQKRLSRIVEDNSVRIDRIVEDVLSIARRERPVLEEIDVGAFVRALLADFTASAGVRPERVALAVRADDPMRFDPHQLRLVLVNLLTNALRYASDGDRAVLVEWRRGSSDRLEFRVLDDGPGLPPEMLEHAFEPFFTTEARGTGLGLFLAREFCLANQAVLRFERPTDAPGYCSAFVIVPHEAAAP